jgi:hypothetical protein
MENYFQTLTRRTCAYLYRVTKYLALPMRMTSTHIDSKIRISQKSIWNLLRGIQILFELMKVRIKTRVKVIMSQWIQDPMTLSGNPSISQTKMTEFKLKIMEKFKVTDLGELDFLLGIKITRNKEKKLLSLSQEKYINEIIERFHMNDCHPTTTPQVRGAPEKDAQSTKKCSFPYQQLVGCLQYLVSATRPDIANAVRELSKHLHDYNDTHCKLAKRVIRYLKSTKTMGLVYDGSKSLDFEM